MAETRITYRRVGEHLRRRWIWYLAGALLLCLLNNWVFAFTRPRIPEENTLRIMLLNVDAQLSDEAYADLSSRLLQQLQAREPDLQLLEFEALAAADPEDMHSAMLLKSRLVAGFGDLYLADAAGLEMLCQMDVCLNLSALDLSNPEFSGLEAIECIHPETGERYPGALRMPNCRLNGQPAYLVVISNGTNLETTISTLPLVAQALME